MNPIDYCEQKAAPPGSTVYYALRFAKPTTRPAYVALYALRRELSDTVLHVSDTGVAETKLAWWRNEILMAAQGQSAHPVLQVLRASSPDLLNQPGPLLNLTAGFNADLMQARYLDFPQLRRNLEVVGGQFVALLASRAEPRSSTSNDTPDWTDSLGVGLSLAGMVAEVGADARRGRIYLPISDMQEFEVTAADILARRYSPGFTAMMDLQTQRARREIQSALAAIPAPSRRLQTVLRAQAAMALRLLDEIAADRYEVLHQHIALTPIRNLLTSWSAIRGWRRA